MPPIRDEQIVSISPHFAEKLCDPSLVDVFNLDEIEAEMDRS
jgi:hypothetical protein